MHRVLLALIAVALAVPSAAGAAGTPFTLDPDGHRPRVAVGPTGNGFFTWETPAPTGFTDTFHYCRVAQTLRTCNAVLTYNGGDSDVDGGYSLFASGGRILLLDARCCDTGDALKKVWSSTNGGTSFTGPVSPGHMDGSGDNIAGHAIYAPAGSVGRVAVDGHKRATVKSKPFTATLGTKGLASGVHHLTATVTATFKKDGKTRTATKDLTAAFTIC